MITLKIMYVENMDDRKSFFFDCNGGCYTDAARNMLRKQTILISMFSAQAFVMEQLFVTWQIGLTEKLNTLTFSLNVVYLEIDHFDYFVLYVVLYKAEYKQDKATAVKSIYFVFFKTST
jgi:hypothetical protein